MHQCSSVRRFRNHHYSQSRSPWVMPARFFLLLFAVIAFGVGGADRTSAAEHRRGADAAAKPAVHAGVRVFAPQRPFAGRLPGRDFASRAAGPSRSQLHAPQGRSPEHAIGQHTPGLARQRVPGFARNGLPSRPFPGEPGFTGVPPRGETRFISDEIVIHVGVGVAPQTLDAAARRLGLTTLASQDLAVTGGTLVHFRIGNGQPVADVVRALETERIGIAQPNYIYRLQQDMRGEAVLPNGDPSQYVVAKLQLAEVHRIASGENVLIAIIDSRIDAAHPDLSGSIVAQYDAVGAADKPDEHGTGMAGAIAAHRKLLGIAPRARILAVHAFSPNAQSSAQANTQNIIAGIDWAIEKGARIINMSFAGPYDPMLQLALKKAHDKGVVLIAAAGNMGPQSPPLYPAADENVIAVTAVDQNENILPQANQGPHIALAAPGVNVLEAVPHASYGFTTGTSVAAAHVSGVAALILERNPAIDTATLEDVLFSTARDLGAPGRDSQFGFGLVDPYRALTAMEAKVAANRLRTPMSTSASPDPISVATASGKLSLGRTVLPPGSGPADRPASSTSASANPKPPAPGPGMLTVGQSPFQSSSKVAAIKPDEPLSATERKRRICRQEGLSKGLRENDIKDYADSCVVEARAACQKRAIAQNIREPERSDFIDRCLGR